MHPSPGKRLPLDGATIHGLKVPLDAVAVHSAAAIAARWLTWRRVAHPARSRYSSQFEEYEEAIGVLVDRRGSVAGEELPRVAGELGQLLLDRFGFRRDLDDLDEALTNLMIATAAEEGPDYPLWSYRRGQTHRHLAECRGTLRDLHLAIDWIGRAYHGRAHPDVDTAWLAVDLAELYWDRYLDSDQHDIDELITALGELSAEGDALRKAYLEMLRGVARLERFQQNNAQDDDLDIGIGQLSAALAYLSTDTVRVPEAALQLAAAYFHRYERDELMLDLERSIYLASQYALVDDEDDAGAGAALLRLQAAGLAAAWERSNAPEDLDAAISSLERALERPPIRYGPERFTLWFHLGRLRAERWALTGDERDLHQIVVAHQGALGHPAPDAEHELAAHEGLIAATIDDLRQTRLVAYGDERAVVRRIRHLVRNAVATLDRLSDAPLDARAALAGRIAGLHMMAAGEGLGTVDVPLTQRLLELATQLSDPSDAWRQGLGAIVAQLTLHGEGDLLDLDAPEDERPGDLGIEALVEALRVPQSDDDVTRTLEQMFAMARYVRAIHVGELRDLDMAAVAMAATRSPADAAAPVSGEVQTLAHLAEMLRRMRRDDLEGAQAAADRAIQSLHGGALSDWGLSIMSFLRSAQELFAIGLGRTVKREPRPAERVGPDRPLTDKQRDAMRVVEASMAAAAAQTAGEFERAAELLAEIEETVGRVTGTARLPLVGLLVSLYDTQAAADEGDLAVLDATIRWARDGVKLASGPTQPLWAQINMHLATALRRRLRLVRDDAATVRAESRRLGLAALRGHAWQVLLQSGTDYAVAAAQQASEDALTVAHWCVEDVRAAGAANPELLAELVRALDAGRGLVLHAATVSRKIPELLVAAGHPKLAEEWVAKAPTADSPAPASAIDALLSASDIRYRVLRALHDAAEADSLLDPPVLPDIADALAATSADALVYLVGGSPGFAVVVRPDGVTLLPLPGLYTDEGSPVYRYMAAHQDSQSSGVAGAEEHRRVWRRALDYIGHWAWSAVIRPLIEHTASWRPAGEAPHLILVPLGPLGLVPWQVAWRAEKTGRRYAVHHLVLSYLTSARQVCDLAERRPVTEGQVLVVGNPDADLAFAGIEAQAIHKAFYPDGCYLGQPESAASGVGTPGEVLDWLAGTDGPRAVLHLACHAWIDTKQPHRSNIRLSGQRLLVRDLIDGTQRASQPLGTVLLAACTTNIAGNFYDEALSLGTAFLAAGARSVFGSLWRVPDSSTSLLMFMVHHYLRAESVPPAEALRQAQLWMLDPRRDAPPTMPSSLAAHVQRVNAADPVSWAGFTYLGR